MASHHPPLYCPEHPKRELEFFNPESKTLVCSLCCATGNSVGQRCQDIPTAVSDHSAKFTRVAELSAARSVELTKLDAHLTQQINVVNVRESDTVRRIKQETERLVTLLRRREEELVGLVSADTETHRSSLCSTQSSVQEALVTLEKDAVVFQDGSNSGGVRMQALYDTERRLQQTSLFALPDTSQYAVTSRALVPEAHLSLSRSLHPMHPPPGVSIAMSERQLSISDGRNAASSSPDGKGAMMSRSNVDCPSGLIHFLSTGGGSREFVNVASSGLVAIACTTTVVVGDPSVVLNERSAISGHIPPNTLRTKSTPHGRLIFDFLDRRVQVSSYLLQHGHEEEHAALRNWSLLGSNDGEDWLVLDSRKGDTSLTGPYVAVAFPLSGSGKSYTTDDHSPTAADGSIDYASMLESPTKRSASVGGEQSPKSQSINTSQLPFKMLALEITGPNAAGLNQIELARVEFYGRLLS